MPTAKPWNKGKRLPPEPLTESEVVKLIQACSNRAPTGIRNRAMIVVLWRAGLRISEALSLKPKDLDAKQCSIRVLKGKGSRSRVVGVDPQSWAILQRWLDRRASIGLTARQPLFCTLDGSSVQPVYVRNLLKRLASKAGIEKRVHPHGLRHTHAFELANEGTPIHVLQLQLGHKSLATTHTYIAHLNPQAVVETMRARNWSM